MAHINQMNVNLINFTNLPINNNNLAIQDDQIDIGWIIDRTPDHNLINIINNNEYHDVNYINNRYFHQQFAQSNQARLIAQANQAMLNGEIHFNRSNEDIDDYGDNDDFIPFEPLHQPIIHIEVKVQPFQLSEEDKNCCVCMETRETHQICQLNCLHKFCSECIKIHIQRNRQESCCPLCRINITEISVQTEEICETFI